MNGATWVKAEWMPMDLRGAEGRVPIDVEKLSAPSGHPHPSLSL